MNSSQTPNRRRLFKLLDGIIGEERTFKRHTRDLAARKDNPGETDHRDGAILDDELERLRLAHEEIFDTHRRFINEHELLVQRCLTISRQTRAGLLNENEMALEVERLQRELARIKKEHSLVEQESRKILRRRGSRKRKA
jgi:hypothetical protein